MEIALRPKATYSFCPAPTIVDGRYIWDPDIRITQDGERGWSLQFRNKNQGFLLPFGGVKISSTRARTIMKNPRKGTPDYLAELYGDVWWNGDPSLMTYRDQWPSSFLNEPDINCGQKFNCEIVLIRTEDYPDMPKYPGYEVGEVLPFIELTSGICRRIKNRDKWITGWLSYSPLPIKTDDARLLRLRGYQALEFRKRNRCSDYKSHYEALGDSWYGRLLAQVSNEEEFYESLEKKRKREANEMRKKSQGPGRCLPPPNIGNRHNKRRQSGTPSRHVRKVKSRSYEG